MLIRDLHSHIYLECILTRDGDLYRNRRSPFNVYPQYLGIGHSNTYGSQTAKDVCASQDTLMDIFERNKMFFRCLEMFTRLPLTTEIMAEVISISASLQSVEDHASSSPSSFLVSSPSLSLPDLHSIPCSSQHFIALYFAYISLSFHSDPSVFLFLSLD